MSYLFLREDLETLGKKIEENKTRLKEALKRISDSCNGGSTWHDNFDFEQAQRDAAMWSIRVRELISIRNNMKVVSPEDFRSDEVNIGRTVTIQDKDTDEIKTFQIGSFMVLDEERNAISYNTPLAKAIIGAKIGEIREVETAQNKRKVKIIEIK